MHGPAVISGATGGIGSAIARSFVVDGTSVVLLGRHQETLDVLARRLQSVSRSGVWVDTERVDINTSESVNDAAVAITTRHGPPRSLVHAAGDHPVMPVKDTTDADWRTAFEGKFMGAVRLIKAFEESLRSAKEGSIVLISGLFRAEPSPMFPIGSSINAALGALAKAASKELACANVRVNVVDPGPVATTRWMHTCEELAAYGTSDANEINEKTMSRIPMGRLARPEDVAAMVRFLCSSDASYITGGSFLVDGGMAAGLA
ncbi:SDR family oxidoreductase [Actinomyces oricola]|uniref:SDR family oxidoreductase n=1 Tax=Actinomyces oricola TaxID=206043 RepID=UPI000FFEBB78|nr:SDR family oxidoreductase [Actinomyces oricola]